MSQGRRSCPKRSICPESQAKVRLRRRFCSVGWCGSSSLGLSGMSGKACWKIMASPGESMRVNDLWCKGRLRARKCIGRCKVSR